MGDLQFDPVAHRYTVNGRVLPSVTQCTQILGGYEHVPPEVLARKAEIGTHVHKVCELHDSSGVDESSVDWSCRGYFEAYKRFERENEFEIVLNEQKLYSKRWAFAGTLDRVYRFKHARPSFWLAGAIVLVDLKTVATLMPNTAVQLAGYRLLLPDLGLPLTQIPRVALQLKPDGNYHLEPYFEAADESTFLAALVIHNWRLKNVK
jgi:hypothetical protein